MPHDTSSPLPTITSPTKVRKTSICARRCASSPTTSGWTSQRCRPPSRCRWASSERSPHRRPARAPPRRAGGVRRRDRAHPHAPRTRPRRTLTRRDGHRGAGGDRRRQTRRHGRTPPRDDGPAARHPRSRASRRERRGVAGALVLACRATRSYQPWPLGRAPDSGRFRAGTPAHPTLHPKENHVHHARSRRQVASRPRHPSVPHRHRTG